MRSFKGEIAHYSGLAAEEQVSLDYLARGYQMLARRWRGKHGEIDLIFSGPVGIVFVEVKRSRTHSEAAARLSWRQLQRISNSVLDFLSQRTGGMNMNCRLDVALVDARGQLKILENATM